MIQSSVMTLPLILLLLVQSLPCAYAANDDCSTDTDCIIITASPYLDSCYHIDPQVQKVCPVVNRSASKGKAVNCFMSEGCREVINISCQHGQCTGEAATLPLSIEDTLDKYGFWSALENPKCERINPKLIKRLNQCVVGEKGTLTGNRYFICNSPTDGEFHVCNTKAACMEDLEAMEVFIKKKQKSIQNIGVETLPSPALPPVNLHSASTLSGTLTINGKSIKLKYAHALQRPARSLDRKRFERNEEDGLENGLIELIITDRPLSQDILKQIMDDDYHGGSNIKGVLLTIDASDKRKRQWINTFLLEDGTASFNTGLTMGQGEPQINNGKIKGALLYKHEGVGTTITYSVTFNIPIEQMTPEPDLAEADAKAIEKFVKQFKKMMPGRWFIQRFKEETGRSLTGTLRVDDDFNAETFKGTLHLVGDQRDSPIDETVKITPTGTQVLMEGTEARQHGELITDRNQWSLDRLTLQLKNNRLVGGGRDESGNMVHVTLRKIP